MLRNVTVISIPRRGFLSIGGGPFVIIDFRTIDSNTKGECYSVLRRPYGAGGQPEQMWTAVDFWDEPDDLEDVPETVFSTYDLPIP